MFCGWAKCEIPPVPARRDQVGWYKSRSLWSQACKSLHSPEDGASLWGQLKATHGIFSFKAMIRHSLPDCTHCSHLWVDIGWCSSGKAADLVHPLFPLQHSLSTQRQFRLLIRCRDIFDMFTETLKLVQISNHVRDSQIWLALQNSYSLPNNQHFADFCLFLCHFCAFCVFQRRWVWMCHLSVWPSFQAFGRGSGGRTPSAQLPLMPGWPPESCCAGPRGSRQPLIPGENARSVAAEPSAL